MLRLSRVLKQYAETGALNEHVPIFGFVDDQAFLTKAGDVGVVLRVGGVDYECLASDEIDALTHRLEAALRLFDPQFRVYQYLFRRDDETIPHGEYANPVVAEAVRERIDYFRHRAARLHSVAIYYVILYQGFRHRSGLLQALARVVASPREGLKTLRAHFADRKQITFIRREIEQAHHLLLERAEAFVLQVSDFLGAVILSKQDAFQMLSRLLSCDPSKAERSRLLFDTHTDFFLASAEVACYGDHLRVDGRFVRVLTLKEPAPSSRPLMLKGLYTVDGNYHIVTEWRLCTPEESRSAIDQARRHFHNTKVSLAAQASSDPTKASRALVNRGNEAIVDRLGDLQIEMELEGKQLGQFTLTVVVYDEDPDRVRAMCAAFQEVFSERDGALLEERYNLQNAFFATLPGNDHFNLRQLVIKNDNYADSSFLFALDGGERVNKHLRGEYLAAFETQQGTPYFFNLHHQDLAHTFILGRTGAGKSFLLDFLLTHLQKYDPYTFVFEMGGSFAGIARLLGGAYVRVGRENAAFRINPFSLPGTKEDINFLFALMRVLLEGDGQYVLSADDEKDLYECLLSLYQVDAGLRTLSVLGSLLRRPLGARLHKWVRGGPYDFVFDNTEDTLTFSRFQCFDFEAMEDYPAVLGPMLFYILHRARTVIYDPALLAIFKCFVIDEFPRFLTHAVIPQYVLEALQTWRKKNAGILLAAHSPEDLRKSKILETIINSCPTKLFLANPTLDPELYGPHFQLNDTEIQLIRALAPKRQLLLKRPGMAKVLNLNVDRKAYWLYTNDPNDNVHREEAFRVHGFEHGLEVLAREQLQ